MKHIFILNPYAGKTMFGENLREKLAQIEGLDYFVFNTRYAGYEKELVKKVLRYFPSEKLRFYCCGGSGTMRNMLNGFEDLSQAEVAFYPCGLTNDFIKCFGENGKRFSQIEELINGDVINVDYIQTNDGVALNTLSAGLDAAFTANLDKYRLASILGEGAPYFFALFSVLLASRAHEYEIYIDGEKVDGLFAEIVFANGCTFGGNIQFTPKADFTDGKMLCLLVPRKGLLATVVNLLRKNYQLLERYSKIGLCENISIRRKDGRPIIMDFDGEIVHDTSYWEARMVHKGLKFVVPKGVSPYAE